jgi:serine/threonine protein kinase
VLAVRDLKLDNTLLDSSRPQRIKLCDFGFAKAWEAGSKNMFTHIGCAVHAAAVFAAAAA